LAVVEEPVTQHFKDNQEYAPARVKLVRLPSELGDVEALWADTDYHSEAILEGCERAGVEALIPA
jgi:hypothetical protein